MSVVKYKREEGKLSVLEKMRTLTIHTIKKVNGENNFPKRQRWLLASRIVDECLEASACIKKANSTPLTPELIGMRSKYQVKANNSLETMLMLIDLAYDVHDISSREIDYWAKLICETQSALRGWAKSDKNRI